MQTCKRGASDIRLPRFRESSRTLTTDCLRRFEGCPRLSRSSERSKLCRAPPHSRIQMKLPTAIWSYTASSEILRQNAPDPQTSAAPLANAPTSSLLTPTQSVNSSGRTGPSGTPRNTPRLVSRQPLSTGYRNNHPLPTLGQILHVHGNGVPAGKRFWRALKPTSSTIHPQVA